MSSAEARPTKLAGPADPEIILSARNVRRVIGGLVAVDVDRLDVRRRTITSLIGPNGAGKSTLFNVLSRFDRAGKGTWEFDGKSVERKSPQGIARMGMVRTFQATRPLEDLSVVENLMLAAPAQRGESMLSALAKASWRLQEEEIGRKARDLLEEFGLTRVADERASVLSGGQRRLLEIARALMNDPSLLMLDEPLAGVSPVMRDFITERLQSLRDRGLTVLLIEHDMDSVMRVSDEIVCLNAGRVLSTGRPEEVAADPNVVVAYLGTPREISAVHTAEASAEIERSEPILRVENVRAGYVKDVEVVKGASLTVAPGEFVSIIGPNGAGKSSLLKTVFGQLSVTDGDVIYRGESIAKAASNELVARGIGYVPQSANVFPNLTVAENLRMGLYLRPKAWMARSQQIFEWFPILRSRLHQLAGSLSGGERQVLAMARALMMQPGLLLLDEPSAGLSPLKQDELFEQIAGISRSGVAILMVEQNARRALELCDYAFVLADGGNAHQGTGHALLTDPKVIELYLGSMGSPEEPDPEPEEKQENTP